MTAFSSSSTLPFNSPLVPPFCLILTIHHHPLPLTSPSPPNHSSPPFLHHPLLALSLHRTEAQQRRAWTARGRVPTTESPHPTFPSTLTSTTVLRKPLPLTPSPLSTVTPTPRQPRPPCHFHPTAWSTTTDAPNRYPSPPYTPTPRFPTPSPHYDPQHKSSRDELHHKTLPFWK